MNYCKYQTCPSKDKSKKLGGSNKASIYTYKAKIKNSARNGKQIEAEGGSNKCLWKVCISPHYNIKL